MGCIRFSASAVVEGLGKLVSCVRVRMRVCAQTLDTEVRKVLCCCPAMSIIDPHANLLSVVHWRGMSCSLQLRRACPRRCRPASFVAAALALLTFPCL